MSLQCPKCGTEFDVTLFSFDRTILCGCGEWVSMSTGHTEPPDRHCRHQVAQPVTGDWKMKLKSTEPPSIESISAVSLATHDMARAVRFYQMLGFTVRHGGANASFTSMNAGSSIVNLIARPTNQRWSWWGESSSMSPTSTQCTAGWLRMVCAQTRPHAMPNGASVFFTSRTRTGMN